ncbi:MAG: PD40 domain-containing protein [Deltaproteobacteria bacterium]|nr:PD40 domain-containing protein [Deltaproteobacteria bacterium]
MNYSNLVKTTFLTMAVGLGLAANALAAEGRLLRFPDITKDKIAFVYANDIWLAARSGGMATRLTAHPGQEWFPKFSPDGKWIAFTGDYDGNREVYVMPISGGEPKRLTYHPDAFPGVPERFGPDNMVLGWTKSGRIIFRSRRDQWNIFMGRPWTVSPQGGLPEPLAIPYSGFLSFSPDGRKLAFNPTCREFRTWKRYRGGMAQDIHIYDLVSRRSEPIIDSDAVDDFPMWHQQTIYFVSERDRRANLYAYDLPTKKTRQLTKFTDFDIKFPSLGQAAIIFELGGQLYTFDLDSQKPQKVAIEIPSDLAFARRHFIEAEDNIEEFWLAPDAKRALFVARGELFSVPAEKGVVRNLTRTSGIRERHAQWSPDGKTIAYLSDEGGEYDLYIRSEDGQGKPERITKDADCFRFSVEWSPDSKKLLFADKNLRLFFVDIKTKKTTLIDQAEYWEIRDYSWSADSRWVAYAKPARNIFYSIYLYNLETKKSSPVTSDFTNDYAPIFDPDGKYLYFLSGRDFNATLAGYESNFVYTQSDRPYAITLRADLPSPFAPQSDETETGPAAGKKTESKKSLSSSSKKKEAKGIDLAGIESRAVAFPVKPGNYWGLRAVSGKVLWMSGQVRKLTGEPPKDNSLRIFDMEKRKEEQVHSPVENYETSFRGEKLIYRSEKKYYIVEVKPDQKPDKDRKALNLAGLSMSVDPPSEWRQMFFEAWRLMRDYFYAVNMHAQNWAELRDRYAGLLPYVAQRADLTYLIGEMIGELGVSHSYVGGGDEPETESVDVGLLGAELEADLGSNRYRIKKIYRGQNWTKKRRSPLTEPGLNVSPGDYILQIDGRELEVPTHPSSLLLNRADQQTTLLINKIPSRAGSREIVVVPIGHDSGLRYYDMVESNRQYVDKQSKGKIGYIHIPDMSGNGLNEFIRSYYPQIRKEAMIVDVRWNGGGFVSQMIIERLRRVVAGMDAPRNAKPFTYPDAAHHGPKVCLLNQWSASDGDLFPHFFRRFGLGKLIGKRSWGGVVGIRGGTNLVDGGYLYVPEFAYYDINGSWMIENRGVEPDIEIDNPPAEVMAGKDAQLDKAIELMLEELKKKSYQLPKRPKDPTDR